MRYSGACLGRCDTREMSSDWPLPHYSLPHTGAPHIVLVLYIQCWCSVYSAGAPHIVLLLNIQCWCSVYSASAPHIVLVLHIQCWCSTYSAPHSQSAPHLVLWIHQARTNDYSSQCPKRLAAQPSTEYIRKAQFWWRTGFSVCPGTMVEMRAL